MTPHRAALEATASRRSATARRSATRIVDIHAARAIARGRLPYLAAQVEAGLLDDLHLGRDAERVEITWTAHTGQPPEPAERLTWQPGTPLPDHTQFASCTVSAPLQD